MKNTYSTSTDAELEGYLAQFLHIHRALYREAEEAIKHADKVEGRYEKAINRYELVLREWKRRQLKHK